MGLIENIYFAYRLYGYIHAWIRIYSRSFKSFRIHGASYKGVNLKNAVLIKRHFITKPVEKSRRR